MSQANTAAPAITHAIHWFEIPALDLERSAAFYEQVLNVNLKRESLGGPNMAIFPADERDGVAGCLIQTDADTTAQGGGTLVYLNAGSVLDDVLARVEQAGGRILTPRTVLPADIGCFAHIADPDGQRIGLHAPR